MGQINAPGDGDNVRLASIASLDPLFTSDLSPETDIVRAGRHVSKASKSGHLSPTLVHSGSPALRRASSHRASNSGCLYGRRSLIF